MPKFGVLIPASMIPAGPSTWLLLTLLLCVGTVPERASAQTRPQSAAANVTTNGTDPPSWLFPIDELNHSLPGWLRVGGEYRDRFEGSHIGNELDLISEYKINKGLSIGFGYGHMFAGGFLKTATQGHDYSYPYAYLEYNFSKSRSRTPR